MVQLKIDPCDVKGFNYHPSYSTGALENWLLFDEEVWRRELKNGKEKFPKINTIRIWLSWNAYCKLQDRFIQQIKCVIDICKELDLYVIPCLFNRWHDPMNDCDGIFIDHFLPNSSWFHKYGNLFEDYIDALCAAFKDEERILVWDVCNEPFAYNGDFPERESVLQHEMNWLRRISARLRNNGVSQPLGLGCTGHHPMTIVDDFCDVYLTHLYYGGEGLENFDAKVRPFVEEAKKNGKPLITSECCWGSFDDKARGEYVKGSLTIFKKYGIGFIAHALQYCGCADLHDACDGRVSPEIGNLCFILKDGTMRPYHEVFNEF